MSLRARLLVGLLALAAVGLLIVDAVSYTALRSYLYDRVDQQVQSAVPLAGRSVVVRGVAGRRREAFPGTPVPPGSIPPLKEERAAAPPPPGTFLEVRGPKGKVVPGTQALFSGAKPDLPSRLPVSKSARSLDVFTVSSSGSSSDFRAAAVPARRLVPPELAAVTPRHLGTVVVAVSLQDVNETLSHLRLIGGIVTAAVLVALAALAWWVIRVGLRPLERMGQTANAIAAGDMSARVESTDERTEVGRLGSALNSMLGQIEHAFAERQASEDRLRRFLADASHELRTPLSSIRGYAEIFRTGAARKPDELAKAMRRIEDEAERMGVLVSDLLVLARLDEVRERVREPVELAGLATEACEDARAVTPDRTIAVEVDWPTEVVGDPEQLRQVVANLLRNALVHTPAGTPIEVSVKNVGDTATLMVRDHGPGFETGDEERVFDRFWRRGESRGRHDGGAGLGLAIVAAIAEAHDGTIAAANAAGGGAEFTLTLPAHAGHPSATART
jgi:two-component system OmpR family sensor kinase